MRFKKDKKFRVLFKPRFDESYITRVRKRKTHRKVKNSTQGIGIVGGILPRKSNIKAFEEEYYRYKLYFIVDLRKALDIERRLKLRISIRKNTKQSRYTMFSDLDNQQSQGLIASLYGKNRDIRSSIVTADKEDLLVRKYMNPLRGINPRKIRRARKLNDRQLFGTIMATELIAPKELNRLGKNQQIAQKAITVTDPSMLNRGGFELNYEKSFTLKIDPASLLFGTADETPADPRKSGTFSRPNLKSGRMARDSTMFSLRSSIKTGISDSIPNATSTSDVNEDDLIAVNTPRINRRRIFSTFATLKKSDLAGSQFFFVTIDLIDDRGLIYQTLKIRINHKENVEDYYAPKSIASSKLEGTRGSHKNSARITLERYDRNLAGCEIYMREISDHDSLSSSKFKKIKRIKFKQGQRVYQRKQKFSLPETEKKIVIMRAASVSKLGQVYGGFSSATVSNGPFIPYVASIYTEIVSGGISVTLRDASHNVIGACFERRNISINEKKFKKVLNADVTIKSEQAQALNETGPKVKIKGGGSVDSFSIKDINVKEGNLYEYRARLYLDCGVSRISTISRFQKFVSPMELIKMTISNKRSKDVSRPPKLSEMAGKGAAVVVMFDIGYEMASTDSSKLINALDAAGLQALYSSDIGDIKNGLNSLIFFNVERYNTETGKTFYLGSFPAGDTIYDDGIATTAPAPVSGQRYIYRVEASLVSPEEVVTFIKEKESFNTTSFTKTSDIRNPSRVSTIRTSAINKATDASSSSLLAFDNVKSKARKSFSKSSFQKGSLKSAETVVARTEEIMSEYSTGDTKDFIINTGAGAIRAKNRRVSIGSRSGPIVKWTPILKGGEVNHLVDFFIVLAKKQGEEYIAGTCLNTASEICRFVDYSNKDFIGRIIYSIIPVFLNGRKGKKIMIGSSLMINRNDKFRRGS